MRTTLLAALAVMLMGAAPAAKPAAKAAAKPATSKPAAAAKQPALLFGIGAPNGDDHAVKAKSLIEPYLTKAMGQPVTVKIIPEYADLAVALPKGEVDAAWMTPIAFARAKVASKDVTALVKAKRNGKTSYRTAYIVKKDSPAKSLADVQGKKVAWVSPSSASGYLFARALLSWAGKDPDTYFASEMFAGSHPNVCKAVREGKVDIGATLADPPLPGKDFVADGCLDAPPVEDFRVIAASEPIPNDVIAAGSKLDAKKAEALAEVFKKMADSPEGKALMNDAFRVEAWLPTAEKDFETALRVVQEHEAHKAADQVAADKTKEAAPAPAPAPAPAAEPAKQPAAEPAKDAPKK
jgi:phosphonate transport system substrate-binding protein